MTEKESQPFFWYKANMYDEYADYYKYRNPSLHIYYYLKHLHYLNKAYSKLQAVRQVNTMPIDSPAWFRIVHSAPNLPELDVYVDSTLTHKACFYRQQHGYLPIQPGHHQIASSSYGHLPSIQLNEKINLKAGKFYTLIITDVSVYSRLIVVEDQPDVPAGEAKIRFIHLSSHLSDIDIAVKKRDVIFNKLHPLKSTEYLGITPMILELEARHSEKSEIAFQFPSMNLEPNMVYTSIITDREVILLYDHLTGTNRVKEI